MLPFSIENVGRWIVFSHERPFQQILTNSLLNGRNKNTVDKLKKSCAFAICRSGVGLKVAVKSIRLSMNGKKSSVPRN